MHAIHEYCDAWLANNRARVMATLTVDGDMAVVSGTGSLTFAVTTNGVEAPPRTQASRHANVLRRQADGRWLIWRRMWGDTKR